MKVKIPTQLRQLTGNEAELTYESVADLRDLLGQIGRSHPDLKDRLVDEQGDVRRFVNIYVGDEDVRFLEGLDTEVPPGTEVSILPAVAGG